MNIATAVVEVKCKLRNNRPGMIMNHSRLYTTVKMQMYTSFILDQVWRFSSFIRLLDMFKNILKGKKAAKSRTLRFLC